VDSFLDRDYVVPNLSFGHKAPLIWEDYPWEKVFYHVGYNFGENFVGDIAKINGMETIKSV
jgi:hypothetical protein